MYHSITIGTMNTWSNWHLIPSSRPLVSPPPVNEKMIEVPGRNGMLDLTEALTGAPTYGDRTGTWEFYVMHDYWSDWVTCYSTIMNYLHGKRLRVVLEDDPNYYYEGRLSVQNWNSPKDYSKIIIEYKLGPFKTHSSTGTQSF